MISLLTGGASASIRDRLRALCADISATRHKCTGSFVLGGSGSISTAPLACSGAIACFVLVDAGCRMTSGRFRIWVFDSA